ncbi:MAG: tyrosine-type recombinase/integrase [Desulfobulbaceae bacterium]|nr:tyrosine-type recombinase/integrase [Desulfobulbaceae bacterium]
MAIRKHRSKPDTWEIYISRGKKEKQLYFCYTGTWPEAQEYHLALKKAYRPQPAQFNVGTFNDILPDFVEYYKTVSQPSTVASFLRSWKNLEETFGRIRPNEISMILVQAYKKNRLQHNNGRGGTVSKRTINKELSYLSSVVSWCEMDESGPLIDPLPFKIKGFPQKHTVAPLPRVLSPDEIERLFQELRPHARGIAAALYYAGLRISEAATLTSDDVDLENNLIYIRGKGDKERIVPLLPELRVHIEGKTGLLWPNPEGKPYKDIRGSLVGAAKRAGIDKHLYHHLLRHSFGATAVNSMHLRAIQSIMGHSTPVVTQRYTQVSAQLLSEEMAKFARRSVKK